MNDNGGRKSYGVTVTVSDAVGQKVIAGTLALQRLSQ